MYQIALLPSRPMTFYNILTIKLILVTSTSSSYPLHMAMHEHTSSSLTFLFNWIYILNIDGHFLPLGRLAPPGCSPFTQLAIYTHFKLMWGRWQGQRMDSCKMACHNLSHLKIFKMSQGNLNCHSFFSAFCMFNSHQLCFCHICETQ